MTIEILQMIEGAKKAEGCAVIIDVFRAFSLECYMMAGGAERVLPVGAKETACRLKEEHPDYLLAGERHGAILPGFDMGNSPAQAEKMDLEGKTVIHTTSAGTQGVANARKADIILTGSLVNAKATARYIRKENFPHVSLVCMGLEGKKPAPEDLLCAEYMKSILEERPFDMESELKMLRKDPSVQKFFRKETAEIFPQEDYWLCTMTDRFDFVLQVKALEEDVFETRKI